MMKKYNSGFTVLEIIVIVAILSLASVLFFIQKNGIEVSARDSDRKTAINSIYYSLEEVYFKVNGYYPSTVDESILPSVSPDLFKDPNGVKIGDAASEYRYEPTNCSDVRCKSYTLRTSLEKEADYIKESANK